MIDVAGKEANRISFEKQLTERIEPAIIAGFVDFVVQSTGIVVREHQYSMISKAIEETCHQFGYSDAQKLLMFLKDTSVQSNEFNFLINRVTVGESYFFRDKGQIALLRDKLLPAIIAQKIQEDRYTLRIWSAGCANGQEIYSIIILLREILPDFDRWKLYMIGSDINMDAITSAINGCYSKWSLRDMPNQLVQKYFAIDDGYYYLKPEICQHAKFFYHNLSNDTFPALHLGIHSMDIILCRNVLIYLESSVNQKLLSYFADSLAPDGVLMLGASDYANWRVENLEYIQTPQTAYFKKLNISIKGDESDESALPAEFIISRDQSDAILVPALEAPIVQKLIANEEPDSELGKIKTLIANAQWLDALRLIDHAMTVGGISGELVLIKANVLANLGQLNESLKLCEYYLSLYPTDKHIHLLQGIILIEDNRLEEAEAALRKAIYLDYTFPEAHYQLGLLQLNSKRYEAGIKSLSIALSHARKYPERIVHNAPDMNYKRFTAIIEKEIQIYEAILNGKACEQ